MMSLSTVKKYLRIDYDDDNILLLNIMICATNLAEQLINKDQKFLDEKEEYLFEILVYALIQELYDKRELTETVKSGASSKIRTLYSTIIYTLRYS